MLVVAKSVKGREYLYNAKTAHKVPIKNAEKICEVLNDCKFCLNDGEIWFVHDVDQFDDAYTYASFKKFIYKKNGQVVRRAIQ